MSNQMEVYAELIRDKVALGYGKMAIKDGHFHFVGNYIAFHATIASSNTDDAGREYISIYVNQTDGICKEIAEKIVKFCQALEINHLIRY